MTDYDYQRPTIGSGELRYKEPDGGTYTATPSQAARRRLHQLVDELDPDVLHQFIWELEQQIAHQKTDSFKNRRK